MLNRNVGSREAKGLLGSSLVLLSGNAATSVILLLRNLLIARLISVEDFGIAATFAIVLAIIEMATMLGLQQQIVQAKDGDDPKFQNTLQAFQLLRGVVLGLILFAFATPLAKLMSAPEVSWAYQILALVPVINALQHFDIHRMHRRMVFIPMIMSKFIPALVTLVLAWPLAIWLGDYRVMLVVIILQILLTGIVSHLVAERSFRLSWEEEIIWRSVRFGWPLLINNILLFAVFNGDRIIVARELGMATLGIFAMGVTLTMAPTLVFTRSAQSFFLPQLSGLVNSPEGRRGSFTLISFAAIQVNMLFGVALVVLIAFFGESVVFHLLGEKYAPLGAILTLMAIVQALRIFKGGASTIAVACAKTENAMIANLGRVALLPVALFAAQQTGDVIWVIHIAICGEIVGIFMSLFLLRWRVGLRLRGLFIPVVLSSLCLLISGLKPGIEGAMAPAYAINLTIITLLVACCVSMKDLWRYVAQHIKPKGLD